MAIGYSEDTWARITEFCTVSFLKNELPIGVTHWPSGASTLPLPFLCDSGQKHQHRGDKCSCDMSCSNTVGTETR